MSHLAKTHHVWPKCVTCSRYITSDVGPQYWGRQVGRGISTQSIPFPNPSSGSISTRDNRVFNTPLGRLHRDTALRFATIAPLAPFMNRLADRWQTNRVVCSQLKTFKFLICKKNVLCDCSKSNYVIAVQLTQDTSRGWMIIHAKFLKFSSNIF